MPLESVELDLPDRFVPEGLFSSSPTADAKAHRRVWRRSGLTSPFEIRLRNRSDLDRSELERPWVSGPTTIDVGPASATWRADWTVAVPVERDSLRLIFSQGLEPTDVAGADVESTELSRVEGRAEMTVRFRKEFRGTTTLIARGVAHIGPERGWALPAAWPADGEWLGGPVTVRFDRSRAIEACKVLQGRRLPITSADAAARVALRFEPASPGPVAKLTFLRDDLSRRARIRSWVRYSRDRSDLLADVTWTFASGLPGELALDLPRGWSVDRVTADDAPLPWHDEPAGRGSARVRLTAQSIDANAKSYSARIHAVGPAPAGDSIFDLPRIIPVAAAADTLWLASATEGRHVVPARFDGVAWLEASSFDDAALAALIEPAELSRALAWRPVGERENITASVVSPAREVRSTADGNVIISAGRLHADWRLTVRPGNRPLTSIPIAWSAEGANPTRWRLRRPGLPDLSLFARPMTVSERTSIGLEGSGPGVTVDLPAPATSTVVVECTSEQAWPGRGSIPLLRLPADLNLRGIVALHVGAGLVAQLETHEVKAMEGRGPDSVRDDFPSLEGAVPTRLDHLLAYRSSEAKLAVDTKPSLAPTDEVIAAAHLVTSLESDGTKAHDLTLRILAGAPRELEFSMPDGVELRSVRQGEQLVEVMGRGRTLLVPIAMEVGERRPELHFAYVERPAGWSARTSRHRPTLPLLKMPCLSFRWTVLPRHGYTAGRIGGGLTAIDPIPRTSIPAPMSGGIGTFLASPGNARRAADNRSVIAEVDRRLAALETADTTDLGKALSALARPDLTLIVDRLGFREAGLSPSSAWSSTSQGPHAVSPGAAGLGRGVLRFLVRRGMVAVTNDSSHIEKLDDTTLGSEVDGSLQEAALHGVSSDGRWVAIEEWQAEPSAGDASTGGSATIAPGRRDFACNGWPGDDAWIEEISVSGGLAGFAVALGLATVPGFIARRMSRPRRCVFLLLSSTVGLIVLWAAAGMIWDEIRWGILLGLVSAWLMQGQLRMSNSEGRASASETWRSRPVKVATAGLVLIACGSVFLSRSTSYASDSPSLESGRILAILPFDGADPRAVPTRVVLRLQDYRKLQDADSKPPDQPEIFAL
ncbi:MAG TPA: hypothetical protein VGH33_21700, partial [Isosphaeraceae bacterium]